MGWASGSSIFDEVWGAVRTLIPEDKLVTVCMKVMEAFENADCDTMNECIMPTRPEVEEAYYTLHPDFDECGEEDSDA